MARALGLVLAVGLPTLRLAAGDATTEKLLSKVESLEKRLDEMASHEGRLAKLEEEVNVTDVCENASVWSPICGLGMALARSEEPLHYIFLNDFMLVAGALMVLQFHLAKFAPSEWKDATIRHRSRIAAVRLLGRNIVILQLYYAKLWWFGHKLENPFYCSLGFILLDVVILYFGSEAVAEWCRGEDYRRSSRIGKEDDKKCIRTRYTDWSHTTGHVTAVFLSQICLFILFVMYLNEDPDTHDSKNVVIVQWLVGVVVTNIAGNEETGVGYQVSVWEHISVDWPKEKVEMPDLWKIWVRKAYDMVINAFCREVLLGLAPVVLATSDRWDFIKDCLAIFFISRLDDLDDFKTLEECATAYGKLDRQADDEKGADAENGEEKTSRREEAAPLTQRSNTPT